MVKIAVVVFALVCLKLSSAGIAPYGCGPEHSLSKSTTRGNTFGNADTWGDGYTSGSNRGVLTDADSNLKGFSNGHSSSSGLSHGKSLSNGLGDNIVRSMLKTANVGHGGASGSGGGNALNPFGHASGKSSGGSQSHGHGASGSHTNTVSKNSPDFGLHGGHGGIY